MKRLIPILLSLFLLIGCSKQSIEEPIKETSAPTEVSNITNDVDNNAPSGKQDSELFPDSTSDSEAESETEDLENIVTTELFESVYIPYANREKSFAFDKVKSFAQSIDYESEIIEPTADDIGTIKLTDTNGDYVYFAFNAVNGVETIMIVSYYQSSTNTEVSLANYSTDGSPAYDSFSTHVIGESEIEVTGTDEQKIFLFK